MNRDQAKELLARYEEGKCTPEECAFVERWYNKLVEKSEPMNGVDFRAVRERILNNLKGELHGKIRPLYWVAAAAIVAMLVIPAVLYLSPERSSNQLALADLPAGGNRAVLTLDDGKQIVLDEAKNGQLVSGQGMSIIKTDSGIVYQAQGQPSAAGGSGYNTITTPRGGQYKVILPDGSEVVLNAGSTLRYPVQFANHSTREVELTGEAYFGVKKQIPQKPFVVVSSELQRIYVRGTHFNVSCYFNEPVITTLEEGKVEILRPSSTQKTTLEPGYQSIVNPDGISIKQVDVADALAWKNGLFAFDNAPLAQVLQQVGRWYDVEVDFNNLPQKYFSGEIPRTFTLTQVLDVIRKTNGVPLIYQQSGRRVTIAK